MKENDELAGLRRYLAALESSSPKLIITRSGKDVTQEQIDILRQEIANLETALAKRS